MAFFFSGLRAALPQEVPQPLAATFADVAKQHLFSFLPIPDLLRSRLVCRSWSQQIPVSKVRKLQYERLLKMSSTLVSYGLTWNERLDLHFKPRFASCKKMAKVDLSRSLKVAPLNSWKVVSADCRTCYLTSRFGHQIIVDITKKSPAFHYAKIDPFDEPPTAATRALTAAFKLSNGHIHTSQEEFIAIESDQKVVIQSRHYLTLYNVTEKGLQKARQRELEFEQLWGFVRESILVKRTTNTNQIFIAVIDLQLREHKYPSEKSDHLTRLVGPTMVTVSGSKLKVIDIACGSTEIFQHDFEKPVVSYAINNTQLACLCSDGSLRYAPLTSRRISSL